MTQPLSPYRPAAAGLPQDPPAGAPPRVPAAPRELPELPDTTRALVANVVKAAVAGPSTAQIGERLDAFYEGATPTFHTKEGDVRVAIGFRMTLPPGTREEAFLRQERVAQSHATEVTTVARRLGLEPGPLVSGRATPEQVRRVTQALIDGGKLPPGTPQDAWLRVRTLMCNYGLGVDCAGYVQQAFLASRQVARSGTALKPAINENLAGLAGKGFARVSPGEARPGDLMIFAPPHGATVGHTVIVRDVQPVKPEDCEYLSRFAPGWGHPDPSRVKALVVDSSWGNAADPQQGGVERRMWIHDEQSGRWMSELYGHWRVAETPHPPDSIEGAYRPRGEP